MINKILKAASVRVSTILPLEVGIIKNYPAQFRMPDETSKESEMIIAETKLIACQLLNDAKLQAEKILAEAKQQAAQILDKTAADAEAIKEQAKQAGYKAGHRDGLLVLARERKAVANEGLLQKNSLDQERLRMIKELEPSLIQLSLQIAKKIIHADLRLFPEQASRIAEAVLAQVRESGQVILKTSPSNKNMVTPLIDNNKNGNRIEIVTDDALNSGDFVAQTTFGMIDGTVDGQLDVVKHQLMEAAKND
ncbi:MAG: FliH/SctL family protein [Thermacetogeniaceae bacterium]